MLENKACLTSVSQQRFPRDCDGPGSWFEQAGQEVEQAGFSASRGSDEDARRSLCDIQINILKGRVHAGVGLICDANSGSLDHLRGDLPVKWS